MIINVIIYSCVSVVSPVYTAAASTAPSVTYYNNYTNVCPPRTAAIYNPDTISISETQTLVPASIIPGRCVLKKSCNRAPLYICSKNKSVILFTERDYPEEVGKPAIIYVANGLKTQLRPLALYLAKSLRIH